MRFAWLREKSEKAVSVKQTFNNRLTRMSFWAFNAVFWIFLLPFFTAIEYSTGFILFAIVIFIRLTANLYVNNVLDPDKFESFPFRIP